MRARLTSFSVTCVIFTLFIWAGSALAQNGRLRIHVVPKQAYAFVDGHAMGEAGRGTLKLSQGDHKIALYNYGYRPAFRDVSISAGKTTTLDVTLDAVAGAINGPWGCITIEGPPRAAVLLNGKTPDYFVGHIDEFNHNWWWKQELLVPPGAYQVTVLQGDKELWSGSVDVPQDKRVVIDVPRGVRKTVSWSRGERLKSIPRFKAGVASATVAIAKPTAQLSVSNAQTAATTPSPQSSANNTQISCGNAARLNWLSTNAQHVDISGLGSVAASGEETVQPQKTTTYTLTSSGPGGTASSSAVVDVNNSLQATLSGSPTELHYKRVGDQAAEEDSATLSWSTSGANSVSIDPLGSVDASGTRTLQIAPKKTDVGDIDETTSYTLTATNSCGASETRTATFHITGSIEPVAAVKQLESALSLHSVYFPTDQPRVNSPTVGLLSSQQGVLTSLASDFKKYLQFKPDAHLILEGHADLRGSPEYNKALSERRLGITKNYLVGQGVPEAAIETQPFGDQQNLNADEVKQLIDQNPDLTGQEKQKLLDNLHTIVLANNRRVDVTLSSTGQQSVRYYPFNVKDSLTLIGRKVNNHQNPAPRLKRHNRK